MHGGSLRDVGEQPVHPPQCRGGRACRRRLCVVRQAPETWQRKTVSSSRAIPLEPEFRRWSERGCDAPSQKGVGNVLVARWHSVFSSGHKNATGAPRSPSGDEASPPPAIGNFGIPLECGASRGSQKTGSALNFRHGVMDEQPGRDPDADFLSPSLAGRAALARQIGFQGRGFSFVAGGSGRRHRRIGESVFSFTPARWCSGSFSRNRLIPCKPPKCSAPWQRLLVPTLGGLRGGLDSLLGFPADRPARFERSAGSRRRGRRTAAVPHGVGEDRLGAGEHRHRRLHRARGRHHAIVGDARLQTRPDRQMAALPAAAARRLRRGGGNCRRLQRANCRCGVCIADRAGKLFNEPVRAARLRLRDRDNGVAQRFSESNRGIACRCFRRRLRRNCPGSS